MKKVWIGLVLYSFLSFGTARAEQVILPGVSDYLWYRGCGPTAAADILGYWNNNGYGLFTNSSSAIDTLATLMHTSAEGWTYLSEVPGAIETFASDRGYTFNSWNETVGLGWSFHWDSLVNEINRKYPLIFLVDTDANGVTDHFVPVVGYDERVDGSLWYGFYTTWTGNGAITWKSFERMASGVAWGVAYATLVEPASVPLPGMLVPFMVGFFGLVTLKRRK